MRIGFIRTVQYENIAPRKGPVFTRGEVYDCREDFARRWIERNDAVFIKGGTPPTAPDVWAKVEDAKWTAPGDEAPAKAPEGSVQASVEAAAGKEAAEKAAGDQKPADKPPQGAGDGKPSDQKPADKPQDGDKK